MLSINQKKNNAYLSANLAVLGFATAAVIGKKLETTADIIVWGRTLFAAFALGLLLIFLKKTSKAINNQQHSSQQLWPRLQLLITGVILCAHWYAFFETINIAGVAVALLTFACFPLFVMLYQAVTQPKSLTLWQCITAALIILGIFIMVPINDDSQAIRGWVWGFISALLFAVLTLQNATLIKKFDTLQLSFSQNLVACLLLSSTTISLEKLHMLSSDQWLLLAICGVLCTAIAHTLLIRSYNHLPAVQISFLVNLEPVYGLVLAFVLLNETVARSGIVGGLVVITAILISTISHNHAKHRGQEFKSISS